MAITYEFPVKIAVKRTSLELKMKEHIAGKPNFCRKHVHLNTIKTHKIFS